MKKIIFISIISFLLFSCKGKTIEEVNAEAQRPEIVHVKHNVKEIEEEAIEIEKLNVNTSESIRNQVIYQINTRNYSDEGTLLKVSENLSRIKKLGVDIVLFSSIQPIGEKNRKGREGNQDAIQNYITIDSNIGTLEDFKELVKKAHSMGMKVLLDWEISHTALDHEWVLSKEKYYKKDNQDNFIRVSNRKDIAMLDYSNSSMRKEMENAMQFWLKVGVDGFKYNESKQVPFDFLSQLRENLEKIKPVFLLAQNNDNQSEQLFDATYADVFSSIVHDVLKRRKRVSAFKDYKIEHDSLDSKNHTKVYSTTNNSEKKAVLNQFGKNFKNAALLTMTLNNNGAPLIYAGQEVGNKKSTINWKEDRDSLQGFYKKLIQLYKENSVFWSDKSITEFIDSKNSNVLIYKKIYPNKKPLIVLLNFGYRIYWMPISVAKQLVSEDEQVENLTGGVFITEKGNYYVPNNQGRIITTKDKEGQENN